MRNRSCQITVLVAAASLAIAATARGEEDCCCVQCGCSVGCQKICRLVCEEKKVDVVCWGCKCEDFCVPKHSKPGCRHCETVCGDCDVCAEGSCTDVPHAKPKRFVWTEWCPGCAKIFTRKKLMKKVETVTVPSYKWVVEYRCPQCEASCALTEVTPEDALPEPPVAEGRLLYRLIRK